VVCAGPNVRGVQSATRSQRRFGDGRPTPLVRGSALRGAASHDHLVRLQRTPMTDAAVDLRPHADGPVSYPALMEMAATQSALPLGINRDAIGGPSSAIDNTAFYIRTLIQSGELAAGERLPPERQLCEHLGVSRVTLRAALKVLQTLGLVVVKRGKKGGTWVVDPGTLQTRREEWVSANGRRYEEMLAFMGIVEKEIAALAAQNRTSEDIQRLDTLCEFSDGDTAAVQKWYLAFHNALAKAAHNEFLERAMVTIRGEMFVGVPPDGNQPSLSDELEAYQSIFEAVRDQDVERARRLMVEHHEFLYRLLWQGDADEGARATESTAVRGQEQGRSLAADEGVAAEQPMQDPGTHQ